MEVVGVAASFIAVVTIALQSTKIIYETVAAIKDGPAAVQRLTAATEKLQHLLRQLDRLGTHAEDILGQVDCEFLDGLQALVIECASELDGIRTNLKKFCKAPSEDLMDKTKRVARVIFPEKDFDKMRDTINFYIVLFGAHLNCAEM